MDLLEYGMQNEKSSSVVKRAMAQAAIAAVKTGADLYEKILDSKKIEIPDSPEDTEKMLEKIRKEIQLSEEK